MSGERARSRVLVTGATGFIGYEVARQLAQAGLRPRLMVRRPERGRLLAQLDADLVYGDLTRPATLARSVEGCDTVIHLGARASFERYARLRSTIVDGTVALADAACAAGVERFVFASSLLVYGGPPAPGAFIDDRTPAEPRIDYGRAKCTAEDALAERAARAGMRLAVVRLPHVYGARSLLFDRVHGGRLPFPGDGTNVYSHLHVEDAARVLIEAGAQGWQGVSPVGDARPSSWNEFFAVLETHYPRLRLIRIPAWFALAGAAVLEALPRNRSRPSLTTADTVRGWLLDLPVEPGLLWKELGIAPRFPTIDTGLPASLDDSVAFRWCHPMADRTAGGATA